MNNKKIKKKKSHIHRHHRNAYGYLMYTNISLFYVFFFRRSIRITSTTASCIENITTHRGLLYIYIFRPAKKKSREDGVSVFNIALMSIGHTVENRVRLASSRLRLISPVVWLKIPIVIRTHGHNLHQHTDGTQQRGPSM